MRRQYDDKSKIVQAVTVLLKEPNTVKEKGTMMELWRKEAPPHDGWRFYEDFATICRATDFWHLRDDLEAEGLTEQRAARVDRDLRNRKVHTTKPTIRLARSVEAVHAFDRFLSKVTADTKGRPELVKEYVKSSYARLMLPYYEELTYQRYAMARLHVGIMQDLDPELSKRFMRENSSLTEMERIEKFYALCRLTHTHQFTNKTEAMLKTARKRGGS